MILKFRQPCRPLLRDEISAAKITFTYAGLRITIVFGEALKNDKHGSVNKRLYRLLNNPDEIKWNIALKGVMAGVVAGLASVFYRIIIDYGTESALDIYAYLRTNPTVIAVWIAAILAAGVLIGWMVKKEPMASGSGIPQVEGVLLYGLKMRWYIVLAVRFVGGALGSLFGLSVGREGPSIQIGAAASQGISKFTTKTKLERHLLITGGAAAGLSAAFNAPVSGMIFALEEVHRSFSPYVLLAATAASLTADIVSKTIFGLKPVLYFVQIPQLSIEYYWWLVPAAVVFGFTGSLMNKTLLWAQLLYKKLPWYLRVCAALFIALPFGLFLPQVLGGGQNLIGLAENTANIFGFIALLFIFKIVFTGLSFGSGTPGGIFMPILSVGALSGCLFGMAASHLGLPQQFMPVFVVCGMAGAFVSSVKAPVTGILLTAEMSGSLVHLLPVALCVFIAMFISDLFKVKPVYETLLERFMSDSPITEEEKGSVFELPVEMGSCIANKMIKNIEMPGKCLIVGIRRGTKDLVPRGNTKILSGDYLLILCGSEDPDGVRELMGKLCRLN